MQKRIENIITEVLIDLNDELENEALNVPSSKTKLYGGEGALDSLALVSFITDLEEQISDEFEVDIILADEKAMSQRTSPFRTVESLTIYIENLLSE